MDERTLGPYFRRDRRSEVTVLEDGTGRSYDAHWLITSSWKAGNFLRHSGVREGVTVGVAPSGGRTGPSALLACFGAALLGGETWFDPPEDLSDGACQVVVAPADRVETYMLPAGGQRIGYGKQPADQDPAVHHFDSGLWSENPSFPPLSLDSEMRLLTDGERSVTQAKALESAAEVVERAGIGASTRVGVQGPLSDPRTVIGGVLAPLVAGGTIVLGGGGVDTDADGEADVDADDGGSGDCDGDENEDGDGVKDRDIDVSVGPHTPESSPTISLESIQW